MEDDSDLDALLLVYVSYDLPVRLVRSVFIMCVCVYGVQEMGYGY